VALAGKSADRAADKTQAPAGPSGLRLGHGVFLVVLLVAPGIALYRLRDSIAPVLAVVIIFGVSAAAFVGQWIDKRKAASGEWRTPEATLHLFELLGGWPGAFLAQRSFRHKTAKPGYQIVFWLIVLGYEYVAIDFLLGWKLAHAVRQQLGL
jgi:uncharacterized membrane protein YsdA (DUF1294 family)